MIKKRTMDDYKMAGAYMRLLKTILPETIVACSAVLYAKDTDRFLSAERAISQICSRAEDNMFTDFPELGNEHIDIFYGAVGNKPRNDTDREQVELAIKLVKEAFEDNWK